MLRCILESLALKYRWVIERLEELAARQIRTIHIVGGGSRNDLLCRLTADATGRAVYAGPAEATAIGNTLVQAMALGHLTSLADVRAVARRSAEPVVYEPRAGARWDDAQATLPSNYTFTSGDAGVKSLSAILRSSGTHSITATDNADGSITGTQSGIAVL